MANPIWATSDVWCCGAVRDFPLLLGKEISIFESDEDPFPGFRLTIQAMVLDAFCLVFVLQIPKRSKRNTREGGFFGPIEWSSFRRRNGLLVHRSHLSFRRGRLRQVLQQDGGPLEFG